MAEARDFSEAIASLASLCSLPPSAKTVHRTVFFRKPLPFSLLVRIPFHYKKTKPPERMALFFCGGEQGIFPRLSPLSPRFARCHRRQKQSTGLFSSERLCLSPSLFESLFIIKKNKTTQTDGFVFYGGEQGIRTLEQVIARYTISNRAPSASSDNSPNVLLDVLYIIKIKIASKNILCYNIFIKNIGGTL